MSGTRANITTAAIVATLGALWLYVVRDDLLTAIAAVALGTAPGVVMAGIVLGAGELNHRLRWRREYRRQLERDRREHRACNARVRPFLVTGTPDLPWTPDAAAIRQETAQRLQEMQEGA